MVSSLSRLIKGRFGLPALWVFGALTLLLLSRVVGPGEIRGGQLQSGPYESYYVVGRFHYMLSLSSAFAAFALLYLGLVIWLPGYRRSLGLAHFCLAFVGAALVLAPPLGLAFNGMPRLHGDYASTFAMWNAVSTAGYGMMLAGLAVFMALIANAVWRWAHTRKT